VGIILGGPICIEVHEATVHLLRLLEAKAIIACPPKAFNASGQLKSGSVQQGLELGLRGDSKLDHDSFTNAKD
jgi:hypothetical protein